MRLGWGMGLISSGKYLLKVKKGEGEDGQGESVLLDYDAIEFAGRRDYGIGIGTVGQASSNGHPNSTREILAGFDGVGFSWGGSPSESNSAGAGEDGINREAGVGVEGIGACN